MWAGLPVAMATPPAARARGGGRSPRILRAPPSARPGPYLLQAEVRGERGRQAQEAVPGAAEGERHGHCPGRPPGGVPAAPHGGGRAGPGRAGPRHPAHCAGLPAAAGRALPPPPPGQWYGQPPANRGAACARCLPLIGSSIERRGSYGRRRVPPRGRTNERRAPAVLAA